MRSVNAKVVVDVKQAEPRTPGPNSAGVNGSAAEAREANFVRRQLWVDPSENAGISAGTSQRH